MNGRNSNAFLKIKNPGCILLFFVLLFASCGERKEAQKRLDEAKAMYDNELFAAVKVAIDSINILYPREIEVRKEALTLMRLAERGESMRNIAFCDSVLPIRTSELEGLTKGFVFEKDSVYDEIGKYIWSAMTVERNVERSYIRCGVNEEGEIYVSSVYFGGRAIEHTGLKLSTKDGTFGDTPVIPYDGGNNYRFNDMGSTTEVVTYKGNNCKSIFDLIMIIDAKERIKVEYTGGRSYSLYLSENDIKAMKATYELASVLNEIYILQQEKAKSEKRIMLINEKLKTPSVF